MSNVYPAFIYFSKTALWKCGSCILSTAKLNHTVYTEYIVLSAFMILLILPNKTSGLILDVLLLWKSTKHCIKSLTLTFMFQFTVYTRTHLLPFRCSGFGKPSLFLTWRISTEHDTTAGMKIHGLYSSWPLTGQC